MRSSCCSRAEVKGCALLCAVAVGVYSCVDVMTRSRLMTSQSNRYDAALHPHSQLMTSISTFAIFLKVCASP